jgi:hypothetical protein
MIKHREVLNAWLDGAEVEEYSPVAGKWLTTSEPKYLQYTQYRIKPTPIKHTVTRWFNMYPNGPALDHETRSEADDRSTRSRIACIKHTFEFEEGEGISDG